MKDSSIRGRDPYMLTRKLTILAATTALGLAAFGGTASADPQAYPGCRGDVTSETAREVGGLGHFTNFAGFPVHPADLHDETIRPLCEPDPV
jgi:hypothetical protein